MKSRRPAGKDDPTRVRELGTTAALVDQQPVVVVTAVVVAPTSAARWWWWALPCTSTIPRAASARREGVGGEDKGRRRGRGGDEDDEDDGGEGGGGEGGGGEGGVGEDEKKSKRQGRPRPKLGRRAPSDEGDAGRGDQPVNDDAEMQAQTEKPGQGHTIRTTQTESNEGVIPKHLASKPQTEENRKTGSKPDVPRDDTVSKVSKSAPVAPATEGTKAAEKPRWGLFRPYGPPLCQRRFEPEQNRFRSRQSTLRRFACAHATDSERLPRYPALQRVRRRKPSRPPSRYETTRSSRRGPRARVPSRLGGSRRRARETGTCQETETKRREKEAPRTKPLHISSKQKRRPQQVYG